MNKNKSLITAFSLSPENEITLKRMQNKSGQTRSEIVRNLINSHSQKLKSGVGDMVFTRSLSNDDTNQILKYYYSLISNQKIKPTIVIGIAVISRSGKVLIGLRKTADRYIKNFSWTFPTGKFYTLNFESELKNTVQIEVGLTLKSQRLIHARLIPDSPGKKVRIVALYYHCKTMPAKPKAGGDFKQIKWIPASDVTRFFTTSVADEIMNFLGTL